jgi:hypothetical protein
MKKSLNESTKQTECIKLLHEVPNQITMPNKTIKTVEFNGKPRKYDHKNDQSA